MFKDDKEFEEMVERLHIDTQPNSTHRENLRQEILSVFYDTKHQSQNHTTPLGVFRSTIMKNTITKIAAAAMIILIVLICLNQFGISPDVSSVTFGKVVAYLRSAESVYFRITIEQEDREPQRQYCWTLEPNHQRIEMEDGKIVIIDTFQGKSIALDPAEKKAYMMATAVSPEYTLNLYNEIKNDLLEKNLDGSQEYIGEGEINGQKVVGVRVKHDSYEITIWANASNYMPVKIELVGATQSTQFKNQKGQTTTVTIEHIVIGEELDESLFSLTPPDGFSVVIASEPAAEPQREAMQMLSARIIQKLTIACYNYSRDHNGMWPENLSQAIAYSIDDEELLNLTDPESELGCIYIKPLKTDPRLVLLYQAYDVWAEGGIIVSFVDCHTTIIKDEATFQKHLEYTIVQQDEY